MTKEDAVHEFRAYGHLFKSYLGRRGEEAVEMAIEALLQEPTRERGEWIKVAGLYVCPFCHNVAPRAIKQKFCDECGADMRGAQNDR